MEPNEYARVLIRRWPIIAVGALIGHTALRRPFFLGSQLTLADTSLVPFLDRFSATLSRYRGFQLLPALPAPAAAPALPRLAALLAASRQRPAFQATSQSAEFYANAYRSYLGRRGASTELEKRHMHDAQAQLLGRMQRSAL